MSNIETGDGKLYSNISQTCSYSAVADDAFVTLSTYAFGAYFFL